MMKAKLLFMLVVVLILGLSSFSVAQVDTDNDLNADVTDPFPTDPTQGGVYAGATITYDVLMTGDLDATGIPGTVITITVNGVTFDGNGHNVIATEAQYGISVQYVQNIIVKNVVIKAPNATGLSLGSVTGSTISEVTSIGAGSGNGITLQGCSNNVVENCILSGRNRGITAYGDGDNNTFRNNDCSQSTDIGINATAGLGHRFIGNNCSECSRGMLVNNPAEVVDNLIANCTSTGISFGSSGGTKVYHNNIFNNGLNVYSNQPIELSFNGEGNYWGHSCPDALFEPGVDSNSPDAIDSHPYGLQDGWENPQVTPGCPPIKINPPVITEIIAPVDPVEVYTEINTSPTFFDPDENDTHTALWDWGDESSSDGVFANGCVTGSHIYTAAVVYTVTLNLTDSYGESDQALFRYVVVYDPSAGFVTGGGWIDSPVGAYTPDHSLTGKANLGLSPSTRKGNQSPAVTPNSTLKSQI